MTPHKWAKEIKAWADGAEIQYRIKPRVEGGEYSAWVTQNNPQWYTGDVSEYRIKPGQDTKDPSIEAFELLKWVQTNRGLLCDAGIRWRIQEVIKTYEG